MTTRKAIRAFGAWAAMGAFVQTADAAFYSADFKGGKDALGRYYYDDPANWGGGSPAFAGSATDPGLGLNAGSQWLVLTNDFVSTRIVVQASHANHGIDLGGRTLTLKGSMRHYADNNSFVVSNGTLCIQNDYRVSSAQNGMPPATNDALIVRGAGTRLVASSVSIPLGTNIVFRLEDGATAQADLAFGASGDVVFGSRMAFTGQGTRLELNSPRLSVFRGNAANCGNRLEVGEGARLDNLSELYVSGVSNAVALSGSALTNAPRLAILGGVGNAIELADLDLSAQGIPQMDIRGSTESRMTLAGSSRITRCEAFVPFVNSTNCIFEIADGALLARTNGNFMTSTEDSADSVGNVLRIVGVGSKLLYDAYAYCGFKGVSSTVRVEDGGVLEHSGRNSGSLYVGYAETGFHRLLASGVGSRVKVAALYVAGNGASFCEARISEGAVCESDFSVIGWWKRDPADAAFSATPGGTNVLAVTSGGAWSTKWLTTSGVGNVLAVTNASFVATGALSYGGRKYAIAIPDPIFETAEALAQLKTVPRDTHISIGGTNSVIRSTDAAGNIRFAGKTDFAFEIPAEGYLQVPIQSAADIEIVDCGPMRVSLPDGWATANPGAQVVLMEAVGALRVDAQSLAAFNSALSERTRIRVKGKRLVLSSQKGCLVLLR